MPNNLEIKIKRLNNGARVPEYGSEQAAGADLYALCQNSVEIQPGETVLIHTGIAVEIPSGYAGFVFARSGLATKSGLAPANKVGVIDADYRGEIMVSLFNQSGKKASVSNGDRIAQLVIMPVAAVKFVENDSLSDTQRGIGGFGSTGKN